MEIIKKKSGVEICGIKSEEEREKVKNAVFYLEEEGGLEIFIGKDWAFFKIRSWEWSVQELHIVVQELLGLD